MNSEDLRYLPLIATGLALIWIVWRGHQAKKDYLLRKRAGKGN